MSKAIPEGFQTVTSIFVFKDVRKAIEFYRRAKDLTSQEIREGAQAFFAQMAKK